jgi:hypothetical protein
MVAAKKPMPAARPLDILEDDWSEAVRQERVVPRYTMNRLGQDAFPVRPVPRSGHAHDEAATAVRMPFAPTPLMTPVICRCSTGRCSATDTSTIG